MTSPWSEAQPSDLASRAKASARRTVAIIGIALLLATVPRVAHAAGDGELEPHRVRTWTIVLVGGGAYQVSELFLKDDLAPADCRWCDGDGLNVFDEGARDALKWDDTDLPRHMSDAGLLATPVLTLGLLGLAAHHDEHLGNWDDDAGIVLEGAVIAMGVNQTVKFLVGRERPFVRALPDDQKGLTKKPEDNNLSFYSGHATWTFALAVGAGTVAELRGYRYAPYIWASGLTFAAATGYLRIAADKHYASDVLVGVAMGSLIGWAVPTFLHKKDAEGAVVTSEPTRGGFMVDVAFVW